MIGIFDSGIGGIVLLKALSKKMPRESFVYLADTVNFPYGEKPSSTIHTLVKKNLDFLIAQKAKQIIVACNTASITLESQNSYPVPVMGVIEASLKQANKHSLNKKVGLLATTATVKSEIFMKKAQKLNLNLEIYQQACPLLAPFVEQGAWILNQEHNNNQEQIKIQKKKILPLLQEYLNPLISQGADTIILGCTHYLYLKSVIQKYLGENKKAIGPIDFLVKELLERKERNSKVRVNHQETEKKEKPIVNFFINGKNTHFAKQCHRVWGKQRSIKISHVFI